MNSPITLHHLWVTTLRLAGLSLLLGLPAVLASAAGSGERAINNHLFGALGLPLADPDGDAYVNALEYAFGSP